jgi:cell division protein FtsW
MSPLRRQGFDKPLMAVVISLLVIGIVMVFSASAILASRKYSETFYFLINQIVGVFAGFILLLVLLKARKSLFQNPIVVYGLVAVSAFALMLCFVMPTIANTNRWIVLFGMRFQPSELAKVSLVLFFAHYFDTKRDKLGSWKTLLPPLAVLGFFVLLILKEPDYSTALFIAAVAGLMLYLAGVKFRYFAFLGAILLALFTVYLFQANYRLDRIHGFLSPEKDPLEKSYQVIQSKYAIGSGGLLGVSLGESTQKLFFLPCAHTDFIFAILGEEVGLVGTSVTLILFAVFLWRGLAIARRTPYPAEKMIAAGLTVAIAAQALLNISMVLGLGPATGIPLPFISFGRSSLVCSLASVGIILNISQRKGEFRSA